MGRVHSSPPSLSELNDSPNMTMLSVLDNQVAHNRSQPFITCGDERTSFEELASRADRVATAWLQLGVGHGDRVAIASRNSVDWLVAYLATVRIGAVLVTLSVMYREREFAYMLQQSKARLLICEADVDGFDFQTFLTDLRPQTPATEQLVFLGEDRPYAGLSWSEISSTTVDSGQVEAAFARVRSTDPAVILYTSGTTGKPKGATLTHRSLLAAAIGQVERYGQNAADNLLGVMPFNHVGGMTCAFGSSLISGGTLTLVPGFHPDVVATAIDQRDVTIFAGVPTMYSMLLSSDSFTEADTSRIRTCIVGGSNLEPTLARQVRNAFPNARLSNLYGLSETSGASIISHPEDDPATVDTTIGTAIGDVEIRIVDDSGSSVAHGTQGELQLRGTCVAAGYWDMPAETETTFHDDGWLATGDMGTLSDDGHVTILGRKKEMYVRGGYNVYPAEIENVLSTHPAVAMCAVIGYPDATFGEKGCAFVVPAPGATIDIEELTRLCEQQLAAYKVPDRFQVTDSLPMTPAGKIKKAELKSNSG